MESNKATKATKVTKVTKVTKATEVKTENSNVLKTHNEVIEWIVGTFPPDLQPKSHNSVRTSIGFLNSADIDLSPREYQREKVASYNWKVNLIKTLLVNKHFQIPSIHMRIFRSEFGDIFRFEIPDGQQRLGAILDFVNNVYALPDDFPKVDGKYDVAGLTFREITQKYPTLRSEILDYGLSVTFYDYFTDEMVSDLFVNVLNNTNNLNPQEVRNAIRSALSSFVRNTSRLPETIHELFSRYVVNPNTQDEKTYWTYFSKKFSLGRMEGDEWLAELIYLYMRGMTSGVTQKTLTTFYRDTAVTVGNGAGWNFKEELVSTDFPKLERDIVKLLDLGVKIMKAGEHKIERFNRVFSLFAILFAKEMMNRYNSTTIDADKYVKQLFNVYDKWMDEKVYLGKKQADGKTDMTPFNKLFGGKNPNVFRTAIEIVESEMDNPAEWGFVKLDPRTSFSSQQIKQRLATNGGVDDYTGEPLTFEDAVGDHYIPRSWGITLGGVTEITNLAVTTEYHNLRKLNMSGDDYKSKLDSENELELLELEVA